MDPLDYYNINMNKTVIFVLIAALCTSIQALDCPKGYYDPGSGATKCKVCYIAYDTCIYNPVTFATNGTIKSKIVGWDVHPTFQVPVTVCPNVIGSTKTYYNKTSNLCSLKCTLGCADCAVDIDFCTNCENGYALTSDNTCLPAVIGLEAASLALLAIGLVMLLIACCYVNKARK